MQNRTGSVNKKFVLKNRAEALIASAPSKEQTSYVACTGFTAMLRARASATTFGM